MDRGAPPVTAVKHGRDSEITFSQGGGFPFSVQRGDEPVRSESKKTLGTTGFQTTLLKPIVRSSSKATLNTGGSKLLTITRQYGVVEKGRGGRAPSPSGRTLTASLE